MTQIIHVKAISSQGEHFLSVEFQPGSSFSDLDISIRDLLMQKGISEDEAYRYDLQVVSVNDKPK